MSCISSSLVLFCPETEREKNDLLTGVLGIVLFLIEVDAQSVPQWTEWRRVLNLNVDRHIVPSESLPVPEAWAEVVTGFSVVEHQPGKAAAIEEVVRVLIKPAGVLAISFDIRESDIGMTFPA
jgi:hypothetical protein